MIAQQVRHKSEQLLAVVDRYHIFSSFLIEQEIGNVMVWGERRGGGEREKENVNHLTYM